MSFLKHALGHPVGESLWAMTGIETQQNIRTWLGCENLLVLSSNTWLWKRNSLKYKAVGEVVTQTNYLPIIIFTVFYARQFRPHLDHNRQLFQGYSIKFPTIRATLVRKQGHCFRVFFVRAINPHNVQKWRKKGYGSLFKKTLGEINIKKVHKNA